jgi:hypothetical protein
VRPNTNSDGGTYEFPTSDGYRAWHVIVVL